jgi:hypothetical protein
MLTKCYFQYNLNYLPPNSHSFIILLLFLILITNLETNRTGISEFT